MKKLTFIIFIILNCFQFGFSQDDQTLKERQQKIAFKESKNIFEGTVEKTEGFYGKNKVIYTLNTVKVTKVFRGNLISNSNINIITEGGEIGNRQAYYSHGQISLLAGHQAVFFTTEIGEDTLSPDSKGFIGFLKGIIYHPNPKYDEKTYTGMGLSFNSEEELIKYLKKQDNITITEGSTEKKSPESGDVRKIKNDSIANLLIYKENLKNYQDYLTKMQARIDENGINKSKPTTGKECFEIFISEYVHGSQKNQSIELFNPTSTAINLSDYELRFFMNGASTPLNLDLVGSIQAKETFVVSNPQADSDILTNSDMTHNLVNFNGDDAVSLYKKSSAKTIDMIGEVGVNPGNSGWFVPTNGSTKEHTLIRKENVKRGELNWNQGFSQWKVQPKDYVQNLKTHINKCLAANELNFAFSNPVTTGAGSGTRYYEFDVSVSANNNNTYYEAALLRINYNAAAFGNNIVANGKVTITRVGGFNSATYINPQTNSIDQTSSQIGVSFGSDFNQTSFNREKLSLSGKIMLHFKIEIQNCNQNVGITFGDQSFTPIFSFFANTANASISDTYSYDNTNYGSGLGNVTCHIGIFNLNYPINGGTGDVLTINGFGFGATRGNGQVKFKNADDPLAKRISGLNSIDYISWTDGQIKIKVPSHVDTVDGNTRPTLGSGSFAVKNSYGDSALSTSSFKIYYSVLNASNNLTGNHEKLRSNLVNIDGSGGYTFRLNPNVSSNAMAKGCIEKAIQDWKCYTGVNFKIGTDTTISNAAVDGQSMILFKTGLVGVYARTIPYTLNCNAGSNRYSLMDEMDLEIDLNANWFYDTTGAATPSGMVDFYEVALHEIGHALLLKHVINIDELLYYTPKLGPQSGTARRRLEPSTGATDGGSSVVSTSISTIVGACSYSDMIPQYSLVCAIKIDELNNQSNLNVFPNPFNDGIKVSFEIDKPSQIEFSFYDYLGREVTAEKSGIRYPEGSYTEHINTSHLANGVYLLKIKIGENLNSYKVIKN